MTTAFLYYHIWAVKGRFPALTTELEPIAFTAIHRKSRELQSTIYALNAAYDHIHVAVTIPPSIAIVEWVRSAKGLSAREINGHSPEIDPHFHWQKGYSVHSLGQKVLPFVVNYVKNQKEHHANNTLELYLEQLEDDERVRSPF